MNLHNDFYDRIKAWARQNNTTIEAIMGGSSNGKWTQDVYYGWRKSEGLPKGENIIALAEYMDVSLDWLMTGKDAFGLGRYAQNLTAREVCQSLQELFPVQLLSVKALVDGLIAQNATTSQASGIQRAM